MTITVIFLTFSLIVDEPLFMLTYFQHGMRDYATNPIGLGCSRLMWEFQAVVHGEIARVDPRQPKNYKFYQNSLWLSPAGSAHGWSGLTGKPSEVVVFHSRHVPRLLAEQVPAELFLRIDLDEQSRERLIFLAEQTNRYWHKPSVSMLLFSDAIISELSWLVFEKNHFHSKLPHSTSSHFVDKALFIYNDRMRFNPSMELIADEIGISVAHLRRLFRQHMRCSPKAAFQQLRERRILQLLTDTDYSLEAISQETGFSESSALSRAIKKAYGCPPSYMRKRPL
jgi:AraC-like DNA-binding protein